jgi:hypothetical protein
MLPTWILHIPETVTRGGICFAITDKQVRYKARGHKDVKVQSFVVQIILLNSSSLVQTNFPEDPQSSNFKNSHYISAA